MSKLTTTNKTPNAHERILTELAKLAGLEIAQGWTEDQDPSDVTISAINYFGTQTIPARDALTPATEKTTPKVTSAANAAGVSALSGRLDKAPLEAATRDAESALEDEIRAFSNPPNAPSTVAKKGFNNPLIGRGDGGRILNSAGAKLRDRD